jgi:hypothetical protein
MHAQPSPTLSTSAIVNEAVAHERQVGRGCWRLAEQQPERVPHYRRRPVVSKAIWNSRRIAIATPSRRVCRLS